MDNNKQWETPWKVANFYDNPNKEEVSKAIQEELLENNPFRVKVTFNRVKGDIVLYFPIKIIKDYHKAINHYTAVINEVFRTNGYNPMDFGGFELDDIRALMLKKLSSIESSLGL